MKVLTKKAFTLVELLIVIGIIGILAVTLLVNLNPAEAQKKTRDAARLKDAVMLQSIIEQMIADNVVPVSWAGDATITTAATGATATGTRSSSIAGIGPQNCAAGNWLTTNVCNYAKTVPRDPLNGRTSSCAGSANPCFFAYVIELSGTTLAPGADYEINVRQESAANAAKLTQDGGDVVVGNGPTLYEIFSGSNNIINNTAL